MMLWLLLVVVVGGERKGVKLERVEVRIICVDINMRDGMAQPAPIRRERDGRGVQGNG